MVLKWMWMWLLSIIFIWSISIEKNFFSLQTYMQVKYARRNIQSKARKKALLRHVSLVIRKLTSSSFRFSFTRSFLQLQASSWDGWEVLICPGSLTAVLFLRRQSRHHYLGQDAFLRGHPDQGSNSRAGPSVSCFLFILRKILPKKN